MCWVSNLYPIIHPPACIQQWQPTTSIFGDGPLILGIGRPAYARQNGQVMSGRMVINVPIDGLTVARCGWLPMNFHGIFFDWCRKAVQWVCKTGFPACANSSTPQPLFPCNSQCLHVADICAPYVQHSAYVAFNCDDKDVSSGDIWPVGTFSIVSNTFIIIFLIIYLQIM